MNIRLIETGKYESVDEIVNEKTKARLRLGVELITINGTWHGPNN